MKLNDLENLGNRRVAALYIGSIETWPQELMHWKVSDIDAFFEMLDFWQKEDVDTVESLFSSPIPGIQQHLAHHQDLKVGIAGETLINNDLMDDIRERYLEIGYDVVEIRAYGLEYTPATSPQGVRIDWDNSIKQEEG